MIENCRRCALLFALSAIAILSGACASSDRPRTQATGDATARLAQPTGDERPAARENETDRPGPSGPAEAPAGSSKVLTGEAYAFAFGFRPDETVYYVIENDLRDICGFPPLLTVTTSVKEKRSVMQRVLPPAAGDNVPSTTEKMPRLSWECDRLEIFERGLKDETTYDSLRHLYPPPNLWPLGGIPGSVFTFQLDPRTGKASQFNLRPAQVEGGTSAAKLSRTAERCAFTNENLQKLLDDLGPLYFPDSPKRVGEQWTKTYVEEQKGIGTVTTKLTCTLRSVRETNGRPIATISISSEISLQGKSGASAEGAASRPAGSAQAAPVNQPPYKLDKADCSGTVEFDLTHGELVQMKLHRELEFFAEIDAAQQSAMVKEIRTGSSQELRVAASHTPTPKPVIVGGRKPPVVPVDTKSPATQPAKNQNPAGAASRPPLAATQSTTRPARPLATATSRPVSLPAAARPSRTRPAHAPPTPTSLPAAN
jgi:hypothetical protein